MFNQTILYSIIGGVICCLFMPGITVFLILGGGFLFAITEILSIFKKQEVINEMNFVEKEKIKYFKK